MKTYMLVFGLPEDTDEASIADMVRYSYAENFTRDEEGGTLSLHRSDGWQNTRGIVERARSFGWTLESSM